jgi:hypothetical protein
MVMRICLLYGSSQRVQSLVPGPNVSETDATLMSPALACLVYCLWSTLHVWCIRSKPMFIGMNGDTSRTKSAEDVTVVIRNSVSPYLNISTRSSSFTV